MIIKSFELNKVNILKYNFYLFYGENYGLKIELIEKHFKDQFKDCTYNYEESTILKDEKKFFDEVLSKSFFENKKLIKISGATNKIKDIIENLLDRKINDVTIILIADKLEKKSKLRTFFEKNRDIICIPFYADNYQSLFFILNDFFKKNKIPVSQEILNLIIDRANGDRQSLKNEITKIENFYLTRKKIDLQDIIKITNLSENNSISELVDFCLAKNKKKLLNIINENNFSNEDTILIIRIFLSKAKRLLRINNEIILDNNIDNVLKTFKPPVFWKDKDLIKKQIKNYSIEKTLLLINSINFTELQIKKNYENSIKILLNFIFSQVKTINNKI